MSPGNLRRNVKKRIVVGCATASKKKYGDLESAAAFLPNHTSESIGTAANDLADPLA
jgi:hypothetical protein